MTTLEDRAAIEDCLHRYTRAVDRLDYDAIPGCYFLDSVDTHGGYSGDIPGLVEDIRRRHSAYESSQHYLSNILIDFYGEDVARVESYVLCYFRLPQAPGETTQTQRMTRCRYVDRFERREGRWAIARRVVVFDETVAQEIVDVRNPEWVSSRRDRTDPLYTWTSTEDAGEPAPVTLFVGLGAMGGPMAGNLARGIGAALRVYDTRSEVAETIAADTGCLQVASIEEGLRDGIEVAFLCLPNVDFVEQVCGELAEAAQPPRVIVDLSTSDVERTRALAAAMAAKGIAFVDAPITRGREAAADGTVLVLAGGDDELITRLEPLFAHFSGEVVHCGPNGAGQSFKVLNNMVTMMAGYALAGATAIARGAGLDSAKVLQAMRTGSAASFSLSNDPGKCLEADDFPQGKFSTVYARKDVRLAMALAEAAGVHLQGLDEVEKLLTRTAELGYADDYYPVMVRALLP